MAAKRKVVFKEQVSAPVQNDQDTGVEVMLYDNKTLSKIPDLNYSSVMLVAKNKRLEIGISAEKGSNKIKLYSFTTKDKKLQETIATCSLEDFDKFVKSLNS